MQDDWEKRMADQQRRHIHEDIGAGPGFGEAGPKPPRGGSGVKPKASPTGAEDIGKLASTFAAQLEQEVQQLDRQACAQPRAWLQGLVALSRAVAATAAELEGEP